MQLERFFLSKFATFNGNIEQYLIEISIYYFYAILKYSAEYFNI